MIYVQCMTILQKVFTIFLVSSSVLCNYELRKLEKKIRSYKPHLPLINFRYCSLQNLRESE